MSACEKCLTVLNDMSIADNMSKAGGDQKTYVPPDDLSTALERIRELELELAQTKLAQVEAECRNQVNRYSHFIIITYLC